MFALQWSKAAIFGEKKGEERVWFGVVFICFSALSLRDKPAPAPVPKPWEQESSATALPTHGRGVPGLFDSLGFCSWLGLKTTWTGIAFCPSEAQLVFCCYVRTKTWTLLCSTELSMWPELIQNSWKFQRNFKNKKILNTSKSWASASRCLFSTLPFFFFFLPF